MQENKERNPPITDMVKGGFFGWVTRIRTGNDRTKTCSVTITPSPNAAAKVIILIDTNE